MRRAVWGTVRLKHLNASGRWPSGNVRYYYRPKGRKGVPLPDLPVDDPAFLSAYIEAAGEKPKPKVQTGTIAAGCVAYLASDAYLGLAASTRQVWRRAVEDIRERYGAAALSDLQPKHIRQDLMRLTAHPANNRLKVWRSLGRWWVDSGLLDDDPAATVRKRSVPKTDGHKAWQREDFDAFRTHWPIGSPERLAFELMFHTCAAIGDMTRLGPGNVSDGWLTYVRQKSKSVAVCPWGVPEPDWFEASAHLWEALDQAEKHMTFLTTSHGATRKPKGAASWFSRACTAAGLPDLSAHGIRKGRAAIFKENGASADQRMAILGHETEAEASHYSKSADLRRIVWGTEKFQLTKQVPTHVGKAK